MSVLCGQSKPLKIRAVIDGISYAPPSVEYAAIQKVMEDRITGKTDSIADVVEKARTKATSDSAYSRRIQQIAEIAQRFAHMDLSDIIRIDIIDE